MNKENWKYLSIGDCATVVGGGTPSTKNPEYWDGDIPWISPKDLSNNTNKYVSRGERFITKKGLENSSAKILPENSLLFSSRAPIGYLAINTQPMATNQGFKSLILRDEFDVEFFYYLFKQKTEYIKNFSSGSTFQEISGSEVKNFKFLIPPYKEQKQISKILSKLDKKIELNQKMNATLEEITKTLFKSWFIDFDPVRAKAEGRPTGLSKEISDLFPDSFEDSELGEIPKGWEIKKIKDLGKVICGKTPPTKDKENYGDGFKFITIPDMHNQVFVLDSSKNITKKGAATLEGKLLPSKTVCVSCIATPGLTVIIDEPSYTNQQINSIIPNETFLSYFLFLNFRLLGSKISIYGGGGSVFENLSKSKFENILVKIPDQKVLKSFDEFLTPVFDKIKVNVKENKLLENILDTLLPKLISGKLKISDAKTIVENIKI